MMVLLVATMVTAEPAAPGAIFVTCSTNWYKWAVTGLAVFGVTWTRARPSGSSQSRFSVAGTVANVTGSALSARRSRCNSSGRNRVSMSFASSATLSDAVCSCLQVAGNLRQRCIGRQFRQRRLDLAQRQSLPPCALVRR